MDRKAKIKFLKDLQSGRTMLKKAYGNFLRLKDGTFEDTVTRIIYKTESEVRAKFENPMFFSLNPEQLKEKEEYFELLNNVG